MTPPPIHPAALSPDELLAQCDVRRVRRSGPGGQRRNKVETGVVLRHRPTEIMAEASERRSQAENQRLAISRLRTNLALEVRLPVEPASALSELWRSRCRAGRISINPGHADFPAILAELLDTLTACDMKLSTAAERLTTTGSQLTRLLKVEHRALLIVNRRRTELGRYRLQ